MLTKIKNLVEQLHLYGMGSHIENVLAEAQVKGTSAAEVVFSLLTIEYDDTQTRLLANRIKHAKAPWPWTLDSFPFAQQLAINKMQIMGIAQLEFIKRAENIIFIGEPGTGKSGLAMGILHRALINGYRGRFYMADELLNELYASLADRTSPHLLKRLANYDILVIDELGYMTLNEEKINMFFKLIDLRYRKKPTIITTNLPYSEWYTVFKNKSLVDAMLDRFKHYCTTIQTGKDSLRDNEIEGDKAKQKKSTKRQVA